ncbi:MAG: hypothetical protein AAF490_29555 [Chloroflexota bacterium]
MESQNSSLGQKLIVSFTAFSVSCAAFALSIIVLIPVIGGFMQSIQLPDLLQQLILMTLLFGLPIWAAFGGLNIGMKLIETAN